MYIEIFKNPIVQNKDDVKFQTDDIILQKLVDSYTKVLETSMSKENLILFKNNIKTLKIEYKNMLYGLILNTFKRRTAAIYDLEDNKISMYPLNKKYLGCNISYNIEDFIEDLYHELLHMSSTIIDKENIVAFSGFSQIGQSVPIGVALDDGYTELLLYRLFNLNKQHMTYKYEVMISTVIEEIITKDKMINLYFNANLSGLTNELQKYNTKDNVIKFLENLDSIYVLEERKKYKKDIIYYHNEISKFIVDTYINKLRKEIEENIITKNEYNLKLDNCIGNLHIAFNLLEVESKRKTKKR